MFIQNSLTTIVFKLQVILLIMEGTEKSETSYYSLSYRDRLPIYSPCSKCNTFKVISDLVHDFINFNALKIIFKIHKK